MIHLAYARNLFFVLLSIKRWFCLILGLYFFLMENNCGFVYSCGVSSGKPVPLLLSSCACTPPHCNLCLHLSSPLLSSQACISPCYIILLVLSILFCTEQLLVTPVCTQLRWYRTRISKSKNKSSITIWSEEKMLLQLSQVKRKLASRSANVQPKEAWHDSVLWPCKLSAKHMAYY